MWTATSVDGPGSKNDVQQDAEKDPQRRSRVAQRLNVPKRTPRPFARAALLGEQRVLARWGGWVRIEAFLRILT